MIMGLRHVETYSQKVKIQDSQHVVIVWEPRPENKNSRYELKPEPVKPTPKNSWIFSWIQSQEKTDVSALQSGISSLLMEELAFMSCSGL